MQFPGKCYDQWLELISLITDLCTRRHPIFLLDYACHRDRRRSRNYSTTTITKRAAMASGLEQKCPSSSITASDFSLSDI